MHGDEERDHNLPINGRLNLEILLSLDVPGDAAYHPCEQAYPADDVPRSEILKIKSWCDSRIFPDTARDIWISIPAGLNESSDPPSLLICQDGHGYVHYEGPVRAAAVLDSLLHQGEIKPTIGVFVMPGVPPGADEIAANLQRSIEYDTPSDRYPQFIVEELLPFVEDQIDHSLSDDPDQRTVCGISSGGICAFNMAWQRPESFGRVISHCGSYTAIRGGHEFPYWIRATERKPIRVFLQSGSADADIPRGNWALANELMADALGFAGYACRFEFGDGGHNLRHGGAIFADALRWLESQPEGRNQADDEEIKSQTLEKITERYPDRVSKS
jgi:enterochelin esterase-like enzyme